MLALCSRIDLALYRGRPHEVSERIDREGRALHRAMLDRPPTQGLLVGSAFARHALGLAAAAPAGSQARQDALAAARKHVARFRKLRIGLARHAATMFDGLIAESAGNADAAVAAYRACMPGLEACDAHLYLHAVRSRLGRLVGGDEGRSLGDGVRAWLVREGVREPDTMLAMLVPGA